MANVLEIINKLKNKEVVYIAKSQLESFLKQVELHYKSEIKIEIEVCQNKVKLLNKG